MESVRRTSSLPSGVFRTCDRNVEQALTGPVADVFLSHMTSSIPAQYEAENVIDPVPGNLVSEEEIRAFLEAYAEAEPAPVPDASRGLAEERMWVLADLATSGAGRARELATRELRDIIRRVTADRADVELLRRLVDAIEQRRAEGKLSVLLHVLLAASRDALTRIADGTDD